MSDAAPNGSGRRTGPLRIFLVAAEESGDRLGAALMRALRQRSAIPVEFAGAGGRAMGGEGLDSLYPIEDFSIIGITGVPARLPRIVRRLRQTLRAIRQQRPDALVVIDSPGYTLWVAWHVHRADPTIPIIDYVSPSVWAWHSSRARSMRRYINHVMALLPFEPEVHRRLGGPPCTYVGHPLTEQIDSLRPNADEQRRRMTDPPLILALPGSRSGELHWHSEPFGQTLAMVRDRVGPIEVVVPGLPHLRTQLEQATATWPVRPGLVFDEAEKRAAFRSARAALAKSGTVTLELALAGVPMVTAYRGSSFEYWLARRLIRVPSIILANLVLGDSVVPEFIQHDMKPERLAETLVPLIRDTPERHKQIEAFARLDAIMEIGSRTPATRAAEVVLGAMGQLDK